MVLEHDLGDCNMANFDAWLDTFLAEKGVDLEDSFEIQGGEWGTNYFTYGVVVEAVKSASPFEQVQIKHKIVQIDFRNGDVKHYFRHLAQALVQ